MKKLVLHTGLIGIVFLLSGIFAFPQEITQHRGLTRIEYPLPQGKITVFLPDDIRPGDVISGSIALEPNGTNERQREKSLEELLKQRIRIGDGTAEGISLREKYAAGKKYHSLGSFRLAGRLIVTLNDQQKELEMKPPENVSGAANECFIPTHGLTGEPLRIIGPFDGNSGNTDVSVGSQPATVIAESPRHIIIEYPPGSKGNQTLSINEDGKACSAPVSGVEMNLSAGRLNLKRGESTHIDVEITGLQNLPDKALLSLVNITPSIVLMIGGNSQFIPIMPAMAEGTGRFYQRFNVQSLITGDFAVNVNLDLPESYQSTNKDSIPPGWIKKNCECTIKATVRKTGSGSFEAVVTRLCRGGWGIGIQTFQRCGERAISWDWSVASGSGQVNGKNSDSTVKVNGSSYILALRASVTCVDGTTCSDNVYVDQDGNTVQGPGTTTRPPPPDPPSKCECTVFATIVPAGIAGKNRSYTVNVSSECKGSYGEGATRVRCSVKSTSYAWSMTGGFDVASIEGAVDGANLNVQTKKEGSFVLTAHVVVTCADGTYCSYLARIEINVPPDETSKKCEPQINPQVDPKMDGRLRASFPSAINGSATINRDEFVALEAEGSDFDLVRLSCEPNTPNCPDTRSERTMSMPGRVRFEWRITNGEGSFVKLGCASVNEKTDMGEHVVFKPPYVPLPETGESLLNTEIDLLIIDDGSPAPDTTVIKKIIIRTKRKKVSPDKYTIEIVNRNSYSAPAPQNPAGSEGDCKITGPEWDAQDNLVQPVIQLPQVAQNDTMVLGQWIVLSTQDQRDLDIFKFSCNSLNKCDTGALETAFDDLVSWQWQVNGGGRIILSGNGRSVIYEAPLTMAEGRNVMEITISVTARNTGGEKKRQDPQKPAGQITLRIYRPGVKLSHPPLTWLPTEDNHVELTSELVYHNGNGWQAALSHMCRIHYFEIVSPSKEKGVTMNSPKASPDKCPDLKFMSEDEHEAFKPARGSSANPCRAEDIFNDARTQKPVRRYTIKLHSLDFGSYGFVRSYANINKGGEDNIGRETPAYVSIPVRIDEVRHPDQKRKREEYTDNRVTIPHDIDENHICDGGWTVTGGGRIRDIESDTTDRDGMPVGDGFEGDGFTTYEEYRGFKVKSGDDIVHVRTSNQRKDIFICNKDNLNINLYASVSGLEVHEINEQQWDDHVVNFNFTPSAHHFNQRGLWLVRSDAASRASYDSDGEKIGNVLGMACFGECRTACRTDCDKLRNAPPNWMYKIIIYHRRIVESSDNNGLNPAQNLANVIAHELLHGNNVCHHGEGGPNKDFNLPNGLRSGNFMCVMRYDNRGRKMQEGPEPIGNILCTSPAGTGYNAQPGGFGNAAAGRGNCQGQIRVSGRGGLPGQCGNR